jgi:hypothetical protein
MLSNRNCFKLLVKMISASPIARCPSFKFLTMEMQPSASWARIADRSIRDHHVRGQAAPPQRTNARSDLCFDDLASGYRTRGWATRAAGYRAAISCHGPFETSRRLVKRSAIGEDRKWPAHGQYDEIDPSRSSLSGTGTPPRALWSRSGLVATNRCDRAVLSSKRLTSYED